MKFHYADIEVAGGALTSLLDVLESSGAFKRAPELPSSILERHERISWNAFCSLLELAEEELGSEEMKRIAALSLTSPRFNRRTWIARTLLTLQDAYLFFLQTRPDPDFPNVSSIVNVTATSVDVYAYLGDGYQPSQVFFATMAGAFEGLREVFGVPGQFEAEVNPTWAHYHLTLPVVIGWQGRIRTIISRSLYTLLCLPNVFRVQDILVRRSFDLEHELIRRRRAERLLAENEASARRRIENIRDIIFEFNGAGELVYVSPNIETGLGYTVGQMHSDPLAIFPEEHHDLVRETLHQSSPEVDFHQMNLKSQQGDERWYELSLSKFVVDQEPRLLMLARDITERHQLDADTLNSQKLETLGVLAGSIAHDFNNLLVPVLGNAEMLVEDLPEDSYQHDIAVQIQRATSKASDLTNQLLLYAGDRVPVRKRVDLSAEIEQVMELMKASIPPKVHFVYRIDPGIAVEADIVQLRQVLVNLITNASESIGDESGEVSLSLSNEDGRVRIRVEDSGCGLSEAEMGRIFSPFYTTKVAGRGLGLAAVQDIVKSHGGEVVIRSTVNKGSTFEVWLPGGTMDEATETRAKVEEVEGSGLILIVDDEEAVRKVAERILLRRGFNVLSEGDSDAAIAIFEAQHQKIDLALLDVMMPKRNGFELMAIFRKLEPNLPVLLVTGYGSDVAELDDPERTAILRKPYRLNELVQAINQLKLARKASPDQMVVEK